jgi:2-polyprenyl-3-methyl-5-hydroxy-6-metoxy-1,4-benzoquinol methylase
MSASYDMHRAGEGARTAGEGTRTATEEARAANQETRDAWEANAAYWDQRIGEGNDFVETLIWPVTQRLLDLRPGQRVLDAACGNGLYARRAAAVGAEVVAFDFSANLIARANKHTVEHKERIQYHVLDAMDEAALLALGEGTFDAAMCNMALFDIADIDPLLRALDRLLRPGGRFVFSVMHPCFNNAYTTHVAEMEDREGETVFTYGIVVRRYMTPGAAKGAAIRGQPVPQLYFHRPLQALLASVFAAGFVLDALEERAFPPDHPPGSHPLTWGPTLSEIPPVLIARARRWTTRHRNGIDEGRRAIGMALTTDDR